MAYRCSSLNFDTLLADIAGGQGLYISKQEGIYPKPVSTAIEAVFILLTLSMITGYPFENHIAQGRHIIDVAAKISEAVLQLFTLEYIAM